MIMVLEGIRVIDVSSHISGPYCSSLLADMGAEVIRVEIPGGDEDRYFGHLSPSGDSYAFVNRMRNKKAITLNLQRPKGREIFRHLAKRSDIVIENFAMRVRMKLKLTFSSLSKVNPSIILASISAFGLNGSNAHRIGFDPIAQAISGAMAFNGFPGNPPTRTAAAWVDYATAAHTAFGILAALHHRDRTGEGQVVDVALADVAAGLVALHGIYTEYEKLGVERPQKGNASPYAFADLFQAQDGWVFLSLTRNGVWRRFLQVAGIEKIADDPRFASDWERAHHSDALNEVVAPWVAQRRAEEIISLLGKAGVPCARVNTVAQAFSEAQYQEREILQNIAHPGAGSMRTLGSVVKLSATPAHITKGSPSVGQHNEEIYKGLLGYTDQQLSQLKREGVI
jgi:crotonobetainyl-CoA:carnitine CoA-transferase CaiB-like acyl-CoA transferase